MDENQNATSGKILPQCTERAERKQPTNFSGAESHCLAVLSRLMFTTETFVKVDVVSWPPPK